MKLKHAKVAMLAATLITFGSLAGGANAAIILNFSDNGFGGVDVTWSGTWDLNGVSGNSTYSTKFVTSSGLQDDIYGFDNGFSRIANIIPWSQTGAQVGIFANDLGTNNSITNFTGDTFAIDWTSDTAVSLFAPVGYVAGTNLSGGMTIESTSVAALGVNDGSVLDFGAHGSVSIAASSIPEPSSILLLGLGAIAMTSIRKRMSWVE